MKQLVVGSLVLVSSPGVGHHEYWATEASATGRTAHCR